MLKIVSQNWHWQWSSTIDIRSRIRRRTEREYYVITHQKKKRNRIGIHMNEIFSLTLTNTHMQTKTVVKLHVTNKNLYISLTFCDFWAEWALWHFWRGKKSPKHRNSLTQFCDLFQIMPKHSRDRWKMTYVMVCSIGLLQNLRVNKRCFGVGTCDISSWRKLCQFYLNSRLQ